MQRSPPSTSHSSPNLTNLSGVGENITQRKRKQPESEIATAIAALTQDMNRKLEEMRRSFDCAMSNMSEKLSTMQSDLTTVTQTMSDIKNELHSLHLEHIKLENRVSAQDAKQNSLAQDITELQKSLQYASDQQNDLFKRVDNISSQTKNIGADLVLGLETKIDALDQQARICNLEICNVPERRSENLMTLMDTICSKINCPFNQKDVVAIHRVPHAQNTDKKPKNIVVKFCSRVQRDNVLSAFRLAKGMKTDQMGLSGVSQPIFMYEHLTLKKKQLFRETREAARRCNFKYVWVKHATILVRELDGTPAIAIRSPHDISRIKPSTQSK